MNIENRIKEALEEAGIPGELITLVKNGIPCTGIRIGVSDDQIHPVVYYSQADNLEDIVQRCLEAKEADKITLNLDTILTADYALTNVFLSAQKKGCDDKILKKDCLNLEIVPRMMLDLSTHDNNSSGSMIVTRELLDRIGLEEDELWEAAETNTLSSLRIQGIWELIPLPITADDAPPMWVVNSATGRFGASALHFPQIFRDFCAVKELDGCVIIPSSTEEVLIFAGDDADYQRMADLVMEINHYEVDPTLQLEPVVYLYSRVSDTINIVATANEGRYTA